MTETLIPQRTRKDGLPKDVADTTIRASVIIPCHDCSDTIGEQLEALSRQELDEPWEIILVDNDSQDDLSRSIAPYRVRLPGLRVISASERHNAGYARNEGARVARGELLLFTDADDVVGETWLREMVRALDRHEFVASRLEHERLNSARVVRSRRGNQRDGLIEYRNPDFLPHASGTTLGVHRDLHRRIGGFRELKNLQDTEYCWRAQINGYELKFVPEATVHYRYRGEASSIFLQSFHYGRHNVLLYKMYRAHGMPRANWRSGLSKWINLGRRLPNLLQSEARLKWLRVFGFQLGRLVGCVQHRVFAP